LWDDISIEQRLLNNRGLIIEAWAFHCAGPIAGQFDADRAAVV